MLPGNNISTSEKSKIKFIYICVYIFLSALFLKLLYTQIIESVFEHDLLYSMHTIFRDIVGLPFIKLILYLFRLSINALDSISLKLYNIFVYTLFGPLAKNFIFVSILFHFGCSILIFLLGKRLNLSSRAIFLSALMYLTIFAHFDAYMWPMAFQHLIVVFFVLLGLNFYLTTDKLINAGSKYHFLFILTFVINLVASLCRYPILILPAIIMGHILFCSRDDKDRIRKYDIWLPIFIIHTIHPIAIFIFGDDWRLSRAFKPLISFMSDVNTPTQFVILFFLAVSCLFIFRAVLIMYQRYELRRISKPVFLTLLVVAMLLLIYQGGLKRVLIPYNMLVPFVGMAISFLNPLQNALSIKSIYTYHFIPLQLSAFNFLLVCFILGLFIKNFAFKNKQFVVLFIFYMVDLVFLYLWNPVASRYFIYLSPLFCLILSAVLDYSYTYLTKSIKSKAIVKEIVLVLVVLCLCIPNLLAIKLSLFRGRTVNTFLTYDYQRSAAIIKEDLIKSNAINEVKKGKGVCVNNVLPIRSRVGNLYFDDKYYDNARFVFMQVFNNRSLDIAINCGPKSDRAKLLYFFDGYKINNADGSNINPFSTSFEEALEQLRLSNYTKAMDLFRRSINERPYLFNYILSSLPLEDLEWVTDGDDLRTWINKIVYFYSTSYINALSPQDLKKTQHIATIMNEEIDEYIQSLFYMSFLEYIQGDRDESRYWFCKIRFLENNYDRLYYWLSQFPLVKSDKKISSFLDSLNSASLFVHPENYRDRYKFEKFLFRLIFKT